MENVDVVLKFKKQITGYDFLFKKLCLQGNQDINRCDS